MSKQNKKGKPGLSMLRLPKAPPTAAVDQAKAAELIGEASPPHPPIRTPPGPQDPRRLEVEAPKRGRPPTPGGSKSARWRKLSLYLPPELAKQLEHASVDDERDMSDLLAEALEAWLKLRKPSGE